MKFGVCISVAQAAAIREAGWDYVEENVQSLLKGTQPTWDAPAGAVLPTPAANSMVPGNLPIVGPNVDRAKLQSYMTNVLTRAKQIGMHTIVFGSGGARNVPEGFDREKAVAQIDDFLKMIAPIAQANGVTIVIEPLNRSECNILNSVGEAMEYVKRLNHPNIKCLVDSYHFWLENEPLSNLEAAMPWIAHVHVADRDGRTPPGESGTADYKPFFKVLKKGGYDKLVSVECRGFDVPTHGKKILAYLKENWQAA
jgi:sugar phosphate isomerase/epimerase